MKLKLLAVAAALVLGSAPAYSALTNNPFDIAAPSNVIDFSAFDGLLTSGPVVVGSNVTFTGDANAELGAFNRDLFNNGAWGVDANGLNPFAASGGTGGELRFTFNGLASSGAGALINHYLGGQAASITVSAYGAGNLLLESHTVSVNTGASSFHEGTFVGITRNAAEIQSISFTGVGVVADNFTYTTPVPEPEGYAMMLAGLALLGALKRRRG